MATRRPGAHRKVACGIHARGATVHPHLPDDEMVVAAVPQLDGCEEKCRCRTAAAGSDDRTARSTALLARVWRRLDIQESLGAKSRARPRAGYACHSPRRCAVFR